MDKRRITKFLIGLDPQAERAVSVYPDDVFITSYPRSGNTWMRFLIANLIWNDRSINFLNINQIIPDIYTMSDYKLRRYQRPRFIKSHEYFDPRYPKVIYLVRDVRSVMVSLYYYMLRREKINSQMDFYDFSQEFIAGTLNQYGSWKENVLSWFRVRGNEQDRFSLIRYEDLKKQPFEELSVIASFLGLDCTDEDLNRSIQKSDFKIMELLEEEVDEHRLGRNDINLAYIRKGHVYEWRNLLSPKTLTLLNDEYGELLEEFGYDL